MNEVIDQTGARGRVSIAVAGDCFPNARFYEDGSPLSPGFVRTLAVVREADLFFANLEMPLSERGQPLEKLAAIRAHPAIAADLGQLGLDVVSLANNHSFDYGLDALTDTVHALDAIGVGHVGAGASLDEALRPMVVEVSGVRLGFVAFSCLVAPGAAATQERGGIAPIHVHSSYDVNPYWAIEEPGEPLMITINTCADDVDKALAEETIRRLRPTVDYLVASVHWGYGSSAELAGYQRPLGHALLDAGADAIFGNHVHAVQGIELYEGKPILYSPGTFIGRQDPVDLSSVSDLMRTVLEGMSPDGYIALLTVGGGSEASVRLTPTSIDDKGLPLLASGDVRQRIVDRVVTHSSKLDTELVVRDGQMYAKDAE